MSRALTTVSQSLQPGKAELSNVVHTWNRSVQDILRADRCTLFLYDGGCNQLIAFVAEGMRNKEITLQLTL